MGNRQQNQQQQPQQNQQPSSEDIARRYEERFRQAPEVNSTQQQIPEEEQKQKQQNIQQPEEEQKQQQQVQNITQQQNILFEKDDENQGLQDKFKLIIFQRLESNFRDQQQFQSQSEESKEQGIDQKQNNCIEDEIKQDEKQLDPQEIEKILQTIIQPTITHQEQIKQEKLNDEEIMSLWLETAFNINLLKQTFLNVECDLLSILPNKNPYLNIDILCEDSIVLILSSQRLFKSNEEKIEWLVQSLVKMGSIDRSQKLCKIKLDEVNQIEISTDKFNILVISVCGFITTLTLYPQTFEINNIINEDPTAIYNNQSNKLADHLFTNLFGRDIFNQNDHALHIYLEYLDKEPSSDDRIMIVELMLKRVLRTLNVTIEDQQSLLKALQLLEIFSDYTNICEHFFDNSIAFFSNKLVRNGRELQKNTIFGNILSLSAFPKDNKDVIKQFSSNLIQINFVIVKNQHELRQSESQQNSIRVKLNRVIDEATKLIKKFFQNKKLQEKVFTYISLVLQLNLDREKVFNPQLQMQCSTAGFINNFVQMLLRICHPFVQNIQTSKQKVKLIDDSLICNLKSHPLFAKLYHNQDLLNQQMQGNDQQIESSSAAPSFISKIYLLTMRALSLHVPIIQEYEKLLQEIQRLSQDNQNAMLQYYGYRAAYEVAIHDRISVQHILKFLCFECIVPLKYFPDPLEEEERKSNDIEIIPRYPYGIMPSCFVDTIHEFITNFSYGNQQVLIDCKMEIFQCIDFVILTMSQRRLLQNPHLRVKGIELIHTLIPHQQQHRYRDAKMHSLFQESVISKQYLIDGLIKVFVDAEKTGSHNQFYDKFRFRFFFCKIFNYLYENLKKIYSSQLFQVVKIDKQSFLAFANLYLNDMIFLLDECLGKMKEMKKIEEFLKQSDQINFADIQNKKKTHREYENQLKTFSLFLHEYYKNIQTFSECEPEAFLTDEIREKLVNNMNYTVEQLNGDTALQYKTSSMQTVKFQPKFIMGNVVELYINFSVNEDFCKQVVMDERCFSIELFNNTILKLAKHNVISPDKIEAFQQLLKKLEFMLQEKRLYDQTLGSELQIPSEFQDPISAELMTDPVQLPNSKQIVDRITIKKHLLNDKIDPFNRSPLSEEQLIEMPELKERIKKFIEEVFKSKGKKDQQESKE